MNLCKRSCVSRVRADTLYWNDAEANEDKIAGAYPGACQWKPLAEEYLQRLTEGSMEKSAPMMRTFSYVDVDGIPGAPVHDYHFEVCMYAGRCTGSSHQCITAYTVALIAEDQPTCA